jgi:SAM-dependent methyltransferase
MPTTALSHTPPPARRPSEWFASWFDSAHYHRLYANRDESEAAGFVEALTEWLPLVPGSAALDLACGAGRHARQLASTGLRVTGLDLSAASIRQARTFGGPALRFRQHDMRVPFGQGAFEYVFSFFTSFGYFDRPGEHLRVVRNIARALRPGGTLVLDYLNHVTAARRLVRDETKVVDGIGYHLTRWADACALYKRIMIDEGEAASSLEFVERVARFGVDDLRRMCSRYDLEIAEVFGDYALTPYDAESSPRLIVVARKVAPAQRPRAWDQPALPASLTPACGPRLS